MCFFEKQISRVVARIFGTFDVHSHFRTKPFVSWVKENVATLNEAIVIEIGCGGGSNIFEIAKSCSTIKKIIGFDLHSQSIADANELNGTLGYSNVEFHERDCSEFEFGSKVDLVVLMDFLEHIQDPQNFLFDMQKIVNEDSLLLISVPTHIYPKVFGRKFHEKVGHMHDGFSIDEMAIMLNKSGFVIENYQYNTGLLASFLCYIYYNLAYSLVRRLKIILGLSLSMFRFLDLFNGAKVSSSLFIVARAKTLS